MLKNYTTSRQGFTIVELLIVIVVIAVLAAITVVAYNGIQDRARVSQMTTAVGQYIRGLGLYATDKNSLPVSKTSGVIACFDGAVLCNGAANQTESTTLLTGIKLYISSAPFTLPYTTTLLAYSSTADTDQGSTYTGYYLLFSIPISQTCPSNVAGARFLNTSTSGNVRSCRIAIASP